MSSSSIAVAHTPGPWRVSPRANNMIDIQHSLGSVPGAITLSLCRVQARESWLSEAEANARLIAAAPELLEALNNILVGMEASGGWNGDDELFDAGTRAYRKATGAQS